MKINIFMLVITLIIGGLIFYGLHSMEAQLPFSILGSVLCTLFLTLTVATGIPEHPRSATMFKVLAGLLFVILLIADLTFIGLKLSDAVFIITNGLIAALGSIGLRFIYKSEQ